MRGIVGVLRRKNIDDLKQRRRLLAHAEPRARHFIRQLRTGEAGAVLHIDGVDVGIGAESEGDVERVAAVGAARRLIVNRVIDAVDLLLDRLRHRGLDHLGVGAGIVRGQRDLRRHDIGELRDRDRRNGNETRQRDDDGNDDGEARPVDEDVGKHWRVFA
jgi:hypothetical protein